MRTAPVGGMRRLWWGALLALACEHAKPDEVPAVEHRRRAEALTQAAQAQRERFEPSQSQTIAARTPWAEGPGGENWFKPYNPTQQHITAADQMMERAAREAAAATRLENFESIACAAIPKEQRGACPLLASQVKSVRNTSEGIELTLHDTINTLETARRLNCHLAFARVNGFDRPSCPLFTGGMVIEMTGLHGIALRGQTAESIAAIQEQARRVFSGMEQNNPPVGLN
jgi:hypothetical protein